MKNIEINNKQKENLLEMCEKLFPEYLLIDIHKNGLLVLWEELPPSRKWNEIHWFEFGMTHLVKKISILEDSKLGDDDSDSIHMNIIKLCREKYDNLCKNILDSWSNHIHPIDYLYSEFKKLK